MSEARQKKAIIRTSPLCVDLWDINGREIKLYLVMCVRRPPAKPWAGPLEVCGPHFESHCPHWLIKLLYGRAPIWLPGSEKAPARRPSPGHPLVLWWPAINTIAAIGWRVSLLAPPRSGFLASRRSKWTSRDDKFHKCSPLLKTKLKKKKATQQVNVSISLFINIIKPERKQSLH